MKKNSLNLNLKFVLCTVLLLSAALLFNHWTPYASDDYSYMYSFADGTRIRSVGQIFSSLTAHYMQYGNGRLVSHFFVMLFLIGPKWIFNLVNALVFVLFICAVCRLTSQKKSFSALLFFAVSALLWLYIPAYGQIFLWLDGSINYAWSYLFSLVFLYAYVSLLRGKNPLNSRWKLVCFCVFTFFFGNYSENVSFAVIFTGFLLLCIAMYRKRAVKEYGLYLFPVISGAAGYLILLLSPSGGAKFSGDLSFSVLFKNGIEIFTSYYNACKIPLILFFVLLGIACYYKRNRNEIIIALALFLISVIASAMLVIASYLPERSMANSIVFLLIGIIQLLQLLRSDSRFECLSLCVCIYLLVSTPLSFWEGSYDIYRVHKEQTARDARIETVLSAGETSVGVPIITSTTKYSCKYGLLDLNPKNSEDPFPNTFIAKYYGLDEIYVIYPDAAE